MSESVDLGTISTGAEIRLTGFNKQATTVSETLSRLENEFKKFQQSLNKIALNPDGIGIGVDLASKDLESLQTKIAATKTAIGELNALKVDGVALAGGASTAITEIKALTASLKEAKTAVKDFNLTKVNLGVNGSGVADVKLNAFTAAVNKARAAAGVPIVQQITVNRTGGTAGASGGSVAGERMASAGSALLGVSGALAAPLAAATYAFMAFDKSVLDAGNNAVLTAKQMDQLRAGVKTIAMESDQSIEKIAAAFMRAANFNYTGADGLAVLRVANQAAVASGSDLELTTQALVSVMRQFKLPVQDAASTMNLLNYASDATNQKLEDFTKTAGRGFAAAAILHTGLAESAAVMGVLTKAQYSSAQSATAFRSILQGIVKPTKEARDEMEFLRKKTGVDLPAAFSAAGLAHYGFMGVLDLLAKATHGNADELGHLFTAQRNFVPLLALLTTKNQELKDVIKGSEAAYQSNSRVQQQFQDRVKTSAFELGNLRNQAIVTGADFEQQLAPALKDVIGTVNSLFEAFRNLTPQQKTALVDTLALGAAFTGVAGVLLTVVGRLTQVGTAVILLGGKFTGLSAVAGASAGEIALAFGAGSAVMLALGGLAIEFGYIAIAAGKAAQAEDDAAAAARRYSAARQDVATSGPRGSLLAQNEQLVDQKSNLNDAIADYKAGKGSINIQTGGRFNTEAEVRQAIANIDNKVNLNNAQIKTLSTPAVVAASKKALGADGPLALPQTITGGQPGAAPPAPSALPGSGSGHKGLTPDERAPLDASVLSASTPVEKLRAQEALKLAEMRKAGASRQAIEQEQAGFSAKIHNEEAKESARAFKEKQEKLKEHLDRMKAIAAQMQRGTTDLTRQDATAMGTRGDFENERDLKIDAAHDAYQSALLQGQVYKKAGLDPSAYLTQAKQTQDDVIAAAKAGYQKQVDEQAKADARQAEETRKAAAEQIRQADETQKSLYEAGQETLADYETYLQQRIRQIRAEVDAVQGATQEQIKSMADLQKAINDATKANNDRAKQQIDAYYNGQDPDAGYQRQVEHAREASEKIGSSFAEMFVKIQEHAKSWKQVLSETIKSALLDVEKAQITALVKGAAFSLLKPKGAGHSSDKNALGGIADNAQINRMFVDQIVLGASATNALGKGGSVPTGGIVGAYSTLSQMPAGPSAATSMNLAAIMAEFGGVGAGSGMIPGASGGNVLGGFGVTPNTPIGTGTGVTVGNASGTLGQLFGKNVGNYANIFSEANRLFGKKQSASPTAANAVPVIIVGSTVKGSDQGGNALSLPGTPPIAGDSGGDASGGSQSPSMSPFSLAQKFLMHGNNALQAGGIAAAGFGVYNAFKKHGKHGLLAKLGLLAGAGLGSMLGPVGAEYGAGLGSYIGGQFANGGRPALGKIHTVGERGRELFIPDVPGTILPHAATERVLSGGGSGAPGGDHYHNHTHTGNIIIHQQPGEDGQALAWRVRRELTTATGASQ